MIKPALTKQTTNIGIVLLLYPVSLSTSVSVATLSFFLYAISLINRPKPSWIDALTVFLLIITAISWIDASELGRALLISQVSSYFVLLLVLRFIESCKDYFFDIITNIPVKVYAILCAIYLITQVKVGYEYEWGTLESFMLIKILFAKKERPILAIILASYMLAMYFISTRLTPLIISALLMFSLIPISKKIMSLGYVAIILITPASGLIFQGLDLFNQLLEIDDNGSIRYEMIKGGTSLIGLKELFFGTGFGQPFRDTGYDYNIQHPLLNNELLVHLVSNHNSLFDLFLRTGLVGYFIFSIYFLKLTEFLPKASPGNNCSTIGIICLFSLTINAYLDSTKLTIVVSVMLASIIFLSSPIKTASYISTPGKSKK